MSYFIGVDIGGMSIKIGLVDANGHIVRKGTVETHPELPYTQMVADIMELSADLCAQENISLESDVKGLGIGCPGTVNSQKGVITYSGNLNFRNVPFLEEMAKATQVPCFIGNDANCAALGEARFGSGEGASDMIMITLGTGVGSGIIINGKIFEGRDGEGAEAGHILLRIGGEKCGCGERGCWEAYASATALIRQTASAVKKHPESMMTSIVEQMGKVSGKTAFIAYKQGDKTGKKVVTNYVRYVAMGLVTLVNIFRPQKIVIGGGVSNEGDYFIKMVSDEVTKHAFGGSYNKAPDIVRATLGNDAGIVGAAALAMEN